LSYLPLEAVVGADSRRRDRGASGVNHVIYRGNKSTGTIIIDHISLLALDGKHTVMLASYRENESH